MFLGATPITAVSREDRIRVGMSSVAWAYLASLYRGDWNRASQVLSMFQLLFNQNKAAVLAPQPVAVRTALAPALRVGGGFDAATRNALGVALTSSGDVGPQVASMPTGAGALGSWFWSTLAPLHPIDQNDSIWAMDRLVRGTPEIDVADAVGSDFFAFVEQLTAPVPSGSIATTQRTTPAAPATPTPEPLPTATVHTLTSEGTIRAFAPKAWLSQNWPWVVGGVGLVSVGGFLWFAGTKKRGRR